jgi:hypothetical protein
MCPNGRLFVALAVIVCYQNVSHGRILSSRENDGLDIHAGRHVSGGHLAVDENHGWVHRTLLQDPVTSVVLVRMFCVALCQAGPTHFGPQLVGKPWTLHRLWGHPRTAVLVLHPDCPAGPCLSEH